MRIHSSDDTDIKYFAIFVPASDSFSSPSALFSPVWEEVNSLFNMVENDIIFAACSVVRELVVLKLCVNPADGEKEFLAEWMALFSKVYLSGDTTFRRDGPLYIWEANYNNPDQAQSVKDIWQRSLLRMHSGPYFSLEGSDVRRQTAARETYGKQDLVALRLAEAAPPYSAVVSVRKV